MKPSQSVRSHDSAASLELIAAPLVRAALLEDLGRGGDLTTDAVIDPKRRARARIVARRSGIIAGLDVALLAFSLLDESVESSRHAHDGASVAAGEVVVDIEARARTLLTAERTALNLLSRLCGIASATRRFVDLVAGTRAQIADTRKTTPGLRVLERYAVRCGGGRNHRFGLDDGILIKDNHLALAGSIAEAVAAARARAGHMVKVEIEVDTIAQLHEALESPIDAVLLDNMTTAQLREAVDLVQSRVITEASGGVTEANVAGIAQTGVDIVTVGWLTHSAPALDLSLEIP
ncbi:MAG TPA: carboxylating nicotinate-nucleotide diphosphorylase [Candidatus Cybelea sp.]